MKPALFFATLLFFYLTSLPLSAAAPYVDSQTIKQQFETISDKDMEMLRSKRILFASRSFGLNLCGGLQQLEKENKRYAFLGNYQRFDVFKSGGDLSVIPADVFDTTHFVHFLATYWPHTARLKEMDALLNNPPHEFHKHADVVIIYYHTAMANLFDTYAATMDGLREVHPHIQFIYVCAGYMAESQAKSNLESKAFNEKVRARYKGQVPLYDLGAILSDDDRVGQVFCPEYSSDPAGVHPNLPAGQMMMAKGFLLILREAFAQGEQKVNLSKKSKTEKIEKPLAPDDPEYMAVRALLDANGLTEKKVESVSVVEDGHIVALYLQEGGITKITDEIGELRRLRTLHLYGDRALALPFLETISPAIANCTRLEVLLLNHNNLTDLPKEITALKRLSQLSLADNKLKDLPSSVQRWAEKHDPSGLGTQSP